MSSPDRDAPAPRAADRYLILLDATRTLGAKLSPDELHEAIDTNDTDAGRQANRRVEVAIFASEEMQREMLRRHGG